MEEKKKDFNSFIRDVVSKILGYGLAIIFASIVLASFPSCSAEPDKIDLIIPGLDIPTIDEMPKEEEVPPITEKPVVYVDIPNGYKVDKNGDYSKLLYPEDVEIVNNRMIYFRDSAGKSMFIRSSGECSASSADNPTATFATDSITLKLRDLEIVFIKK